MRILCTDILKIFTILNEWILKNQLWLKSFLSVLSQQVVQPSVRPYAAHRPRTRFRVVVRLRWPYKWLARFTSGCPAAQAIGRKGGPLECDTTQCILHLTTAYTWPLWWCWPTSRSSPCSSLWAEPSRGSTDNSTSARRTCQEGTGVCL